MYAADVQEAPSATTSGAAAPPGDWVPLCKPEELPKGE
jgi:hypothetical protein